MPEENKEVKIEAYAKLGISVSALDWRYSGDILLIYPADSMNVRLLKWSAEVGEGSAVNGDTKTFRSAKYKIKDYESNTPIAPEIVKGYFVEPIDKALDVMKSKNVTNIERIDYTLRIPGEDMEKWERWWKVVSELRG